VHTAPPAGGVRSRRYGPPARRRKCLICAGRDGNGDVVLARLRILGDEAAAGIMYAPPALNRSLETRLETPSATSRSVPRKTATSLRPRPSPSATRRANCNTFSTPCGKGRQRAGRRGLHDHPRPEHGDDRTALVRPHHLHTPDCPLTVGRRDSLRGRSRRVDPFAASVREHPPITRGSPTVAASGKCRSSRLQQQALAAVVAGADHANDGDGAAALSAWLRGSTVRRSVPPV
jgi:hypothetical protein